MRKIIFRAPVVGREKAPYPSKADLGAQDDAENGNGRRFTRECDAGSATRPLKHAAPASCGGGEGRAKWTRCGKAFRLAAGRRLSA